MGAGSGCRRVSSPRGPFRPRHWWGQGCADRPLWCPRPYPGGMSLEGVLPEIIPAFERL